MSQGIKDTNILPSFDDWSYDVLADYTGSDRKEGLIATNGSRYLIKYADNHTRINNMDTSYVNNVICEYLSSHILALVGYKTHDTILGTRNGEIVVACENFLDNNSKLIEFGVLLRKRYYSNQLERVPALEQIKTVMETDNILSNNSDRYFSNYCERLIGDALVGNFDRHMGNWGYVVSKESVDIAPIYDNGSTLFPALSEKGMLEVLSNQDEIDKRVFLFPKVALNINGIKVSYWDILSSNYVPEITDALIKVAPMIKDKMEDVYRFINSCPYLSDNRKYFYNTILRERFEKLIMKAYNLCVEKKFDVAAYERIANGISYDENLFLEQIKDKTKNI